MKASLCFLLGFINFGFASTAYAEALQSIGWLERVNINQHDITLQAKIDTGADNSSIHASDINVFDKDGIKMVQFTIQNKNGQTVILQKPLVRFALIKRKGAEPLKRPVVSMDLCIGSTLKTANINLANRENFQYRMLIGRSYLKDLYLVDSNRKFTAEPNCDSSLAKNEPA